MTGQEAMGVMLITMITVIIAYCISVVIETGCHVYWRILTSDGKIFFIEKWTLRKPVWTRDWTEYTTVDDARAYILKNWEAKKEDIQYRTVYEITTKK